MTLPRDKRHITHTGTTFWLVRSLCLKKKRKPWAHGVHRAHTYAKLARRLYIYIYIHTHGRPLPTRWPSYTPFASESFVRDRSQHAVSRRDDALRHRHQAVRQGDHRTRPAAARAAPHGGRAAAAGVNGARERGPAGGGRAGARGGGRGEAAVPTVPESGHQVLLLQQLQRQPAAPLLPGMPPLLDGWRRNPQRARRIRPPQEPRDAAAIVGAARCHHHHQ
jgi:hypothetical protein